MKWLRLYSELPNDIKLRRMTPEQKWLWVCLLCVANESPVRGSLLIAEGVPMEANDMARHAGLGIACVMKTLQLFVTMKMLHQVDGVYIVSNFQKRQYDKDSDRSEATRLRKRRQRERESAVLARETGGFAQENDGSTLENVTCHADVTPMSRVDTETDTESELESESKRSVHADAFQNDEIAVKEDEDDFSTFEKAGNVSSGLEGSSESLAFDELLASQVLKTAGLKNLSKRQERELDRVLDMLRAARARPHQVAEFGDWFMYHDRQQPRTPPHLSQFLSDWRHYLRWLEANEGDGNFDDSSNGGDGAAGHTKRNEQEDRPDKRGGGTGTGGYDLSTYHNSTYRSDGYRSDGYRSDGYRSDGYGNNRYGTRLSAGERAAARMRDIRAELGREAAEIFGQVGVELHGQSLSGLVHHDGVLVH